MSSLPENAMLLIIDMQNGFNEPVWGRRNNPQAEEIHAVALVTLHEEFATMVETDELLRQLEPQR